jgi:transcriptional regulator with XRE-family HTH domain
MQTGSRSRRSIEPLFGTVVRQHREARGLSQEELADQCDLHRTYISQLERGLKSPSLRSLVAIAEALQSRPSHLMREVEDLQDAAA